MPSPPPEGERVLERPAAIGAAEEALRKGLLTRLEQASEAMPIDSKASSASGPAFRDTKAGVQHDLRARLRSEVQEVIDGEDYGARTRACDRFAALVTSTNPARSAAASADVRLLGDCQQYLGNGSYRWLIEPAFESATGARPAADVDLRPFALATRAACLARLEPLIGSVFVPTDLPQGANS